MEEERSKRPVRRVKRGWMPLRVTERVEETHDTVTLRMVNDDEDVRAFDYTAGQYLTFRFDSLAEKPLVRSYTMSSSPRQISDFAVTVKIVPGGVASEYLCRDVKVGDILRARGPIGRFTYDATKMQKRLVMIAAGSGVTPFVSIMRELHDRLGTDVSPEAMKLIVSFRSREDLILWDDLQKCAQSAGVELVTSLSRERVMNAAFRYGRVDAATIDDVLRGDYSDTTFMTCGPQGLMDLTAAHLSASGVSDENIVSESFDN